MSLKISNSSKCKMQILSIALIINYCSSLYLMSSSGLFNDIISNLSLLISLIIALLFVYFHRHNNKIYIWILIYAILFFAYRICKRREILDLFTMVSFFYGEKIEIINNKVLKTSCLFVAVVVLLNILHILPTSPEFFRGVINRYTLGFIHPNSIGHFAIIISECLFVRDYKKKSLKTTIKLLLLTIIPFLIANCRTALVVISAMTFLYIMNIIGFNLLKNIFKSKLVRILLPLLMIVLVYLLIYVSKNWSEFQELNVLFNSRIQNNFLFLQKYEIKFFGNLEVNGWISVYDNWGQVYLDSGYLQGILCLGVLNSLTYLYIFIRSLIDNLKNKSYEIVMILIIVSFMLIIEASPLRWYFSFVLLYQGSSRAKKNIFI